MKQFEQKRKLLDRVMRDFRRHIRTNLTRPLREHANDKIEEIIEEAKHDRPK